MFLTVAGNVIEDVHIDYVTPVSFISTHPPIFQLQLSNNGTIVSPYVGTITLTNVSGREVGKMMINTDVEKVYAGMKKVDAITIPKLSWRDIGPLRASVLVQYGVGQKMTSHSTVVWYLPLWSYGVLVFLIGGIVWFALYLKRIKQS